MTQENESYSKEKKEKENIKYSLNESKSLLYIYRDNLLKYLPLREDDIPIYKDFYHYFKDKEITDKEIEIWSESFNRFALILNNNNILFLDIDNPRIIKYFFDIEDLKKETWISQSKSGGYHIYFKRARNNKIEIKSSFIEIYTKHLAKEAPTPNYKWLSDITKINIKEMDIETENKILEKVKFITKWDRLLRILDKIYYKDQRDWITLYLAGFFKKCGFDIEDCKEISKILCILNKDEEKSMRINVIEHTYKKADNEIKGLRGLLELLEKEQYEDKEKDVEYLKNLAKKGTSKKYISNFHINTKSSREQIFNEFINYLQNKYKYFKDEEGIPCIYLENKIIKLNNNNLEFNNFIAEEYFKLFPNHNKVLIKKTEVRDVIVGKFCAQNPNTKIPIFLEKQKNNIYINLNNGQELVITLNNIYIQEKTQYWMPNNHNKPIKIDLNAEVEDIELLLKYFNMDQEDKLLLLTYIASVYIQDIQHPILILEGPAGSGKTTLFKILSELIQPTDIPILSLPLKADDLPNILSNCYINFFDNISSVNYDILDFLARAVTGEGIKKRKLYTDKDIIEFTYKRLIGLNGINLAVTRADIIDRSLIIHLKRLPNFKSEKAIFEELKKDLPKIRGALFKLIQYALFYSDKSIKIAQYRLVDWLDFAIKFADALNIEKDTFLEIIKKKILKQKKEVIGENTLGILFENLLNELKYLDTDLDKDIQNDIVKEYKNILWIGTASRLLNHIKYYAEEQGIGFNISQPHILMRRINEIKNELKEVYNIDIKTIHKKHKRIVLILDLKGNYDGANENKSQKENNNDNIKNNINQNKNNNELEIKIKALLSHSREKGLQAIRIKDISRILNINEDIIKLQLEKMNIEITSNSGIIVLNKVIQKKNNKERKFTKKELKEIFKKAFNNEQIKRKSEIRVYLIVDAKLTSKESIKAIEDGIKYGIIKKERNYLIWNAD